MLGLGVRAVAAGCGGNKVGECVAAAVAGVARGNGNTAGVSNHLALLGSVTSFVSRGNWATKLGGDASGFKGVSASVAASGGVVITACVINIFSKFAMPLTSKGRKGANAHSFSAFISLFILSVALSDVTNLVVTVANSVFNVASSSFDVASLILTVANSVLKVANSFLIKDISFSNKSLIMVTNKVLG